MRLSNRLLSNAATTYLRLGATFLFGVFFVWYAIGKVGVTGFGMLAFATATSGLSGAVQEAIQQSLVRELAAAIATGEISRVRKSLTCAIVLCAPAAVLLVLVSALIAALAYFGVFNTPANLSGLSLGLAILLLIEGFHAGIRLACAPYTQGLLAAQHVGLDNLWMGLGRLTNPVAAVVVFGYLLPQAGLADKLLGFAAARGTLQLLHIALGVWLAKLRVPGLKFQRSAFDHAEFRSILGTVWHTGQFTLLMNLNVQFLAILINLFFGMTYNAVWQIVAQLGGYARLFSQALLRGVDPLSAHMQQQGRQAAIVDLMMRTIRYQVGSVLPVVATLTIFMHPILNLWVAGRMAGSQQLAWAGLTVAQAIDMIAVMAYVHLAAQVVRGSTFGVERMLYGLGHVRSYSWFAKYAAVLNVGLAALLMWYFETPIVAPISLFVVYSIYYPGIILGAAARRVGLPVARTLWAIPRPVVASAILCVPLVLLRWQLPQLTVLSLVGVAGGAAAMSGILMYAIGLEADERARINQLLWRRKPGAGVQPSVLDEQRIDDGTLN